MYQYLPAQFIKPVQETAKIVQNGVIFKWDIAR